MISPPAEDADISGSLVLHALCRAAAGGLRLSLQLHTPTGRAAAGAGVGAGGAPAGGPGSLPAVVLQRRPVLEVWASRAARPQQQQQQQHVEYADKGDQEHSARGLFVYAAPQRAQSLDAGGAAEAPAPPAQLTGHSGGARPRRPLQAQQEGTGVPAAADGAGDGAAAVVGDEAGAASPLFLPFAVGRLPGVRRQAEEACLAAVRQLAAAPPLGQQQQQQPEDDGEQPARPKKRSKTTAPGGGGARAGAAAAAAAAQEREDAAEARLRAVLSAVRAAGAQGVTAAEADQRLGAASAEAGAAPGLGGGRLLALLVRHGLARELGAWSGSCYVAAEASQRLLSFPVPQGPQLEPLLSGAGAGEGVAAGAAAARAAGHSGVDEVAAAAAAAAPPRTPGKAGKGKGSKAKAGRSPGKLPQAEQAAGPGPTAAAPATVGSADEDSGEAVLHAARHEVPVRPWLDHTGRVNLALWQALVQRAMGAVIRNPGTTE
ncbi:hypothetical protein MNEG_5591 [Monoraphidium neglectum]|uniref:Uncharacterized protein n=1 Tax=Monoraphidium neglectum TaxID=145388 RepID=A0A0D2L5R6_9CHLO|nr:hypothetical protein MNEG_5591 [Monoraphidium neglectum]KIZ02364.1 hypothetical protein MNEG_5591 [Monoraphidium neglectum]|eukprot:XP_013901383.1 hypothetical protein MNEG_5591 [Monoraphidium neglectum]